VDFSRENLTFISLKIYKIAYFYVLIYNLININGGYMEIKLGRKTDGSKAIINSEIIKMFVVGDIASGKSHFCH
jgi:hypothetical protein